MFVTLNTPNTYAPIHAIHIPYLFKSPSIRLEFCLVLGSLDSFSIDVSNCITNGIYKSQQ